MSESHIYPVLTQEELYDVYRLLPVFSLRYLIHAFQEGEERYDIPELGRKPTNPGECSYNDLSILENTFHLAGHLSSVLDTVDKILANNGYTYVLSASPYEDIIHAAGRLLIMASLIRDAELQHIVYIHTETHHG